METYLSHSAKHYHGYWFESSWIQLNFFFPLNGEFALRVLRNYPLTLEKSRILYTYRSPIVLIKTSNTWKQLWCSTVQKFPLNALSHDLHTLNMNLLMFRAHSLSELQKCVMDCRIVLWLKGSFINLTVDRYDFYRVAKLYSSHFYAAFEPT